MELLLVSIFMTENVEQLYKDQMTDYKEEFIVKTFAFTLSMPNRASWNGRWTGEDKQYVKFRRLTEQQIQESGIEDGASFPYDFGDGWRARVDVRVVDSKERQRLQRKSAGFANYDWMIDSIVKQGKIVA